MNNMKVNNDLWEQVRNYFFQKSYHGSKHDPEVPYILQREEMSGDNVVEHPKHYTSHPSGIECIEITKHFNFCLGSAIKYIWRADSKGNDIQDLRKAKQFIEFEIKRREEGLKHAR